MIFVHRESAVGPVIRTSGLASRGPDDPIVVDPAMVRLYALVDVVAPSALSVLVLGETGTGKELYAHAIHDRSDRARRPFVAINCAAVPEALLEAELFGYERGAFTGAVATKQGLFESADGGTLFLDEIGEMPVATQSKLLRVLQTGEVTRVGGLRPKRVNVRVVSATNAHLDSEITAGRFRADLLFRINGFVVTLPPLRERTSEILPLAAQVISRACAKAARPPLPLTEATAQTLLSYAWPGNVRELKNVLERAVVLSRSANSIDVDALMLPTAPAGKDIRGAPPRARDPRATLPPDGPGERERILDALQRSAGNQKEAATVLGISRQTLLRKLDAYGIARPRKRT
jgi:transcriptional regulator with PAS, ATPase and Fis domain